MGIEFCQIIEVEQGFHIAVGLRHAAIEGLHDVVYAEGAVIVGKQFEYGQEFGIGSHVSLKVVLGCQSM